MSFVGRSVTYMTTHSLIHLPPHGQIGPSLKVGDQLNKIKEMTLTIVDGGVLLAGQGGIEVLIPFNNISHMRLAPEVKAAKK